MVKYSAKKRTGSKKQSFKKRKYNKKKGGGDGDDAAAVDAENTTTTTTTTTDDAAADSENDLKQFYVDLIERILNQIDNICKKENKEERKTMLENAIMGKTE
jgi:hypothetical protein